MTPSIQGILELITTYAVFLIPLVIIQLTLAITALVHVLKHNTYRFGNRVMWVIIVLFVNIIGPIVYFVAGRGEE